ncbi:MAG: SGNH/GDSL hydrolase family protein [Mucinivorans sp.]
MKKIILTALILFISFVAPAQTQWTDAKQLTIGGHAPWVSRTPYERLPAAMKGTVRDQLWNLGCNSSGLYVRFRTDSPTISAHWLLTGNNSMYHMTDAGIKGVDLYFLNGKKWQYVATGGANGLNTSRRLIGDMKPEMREYMMYLPLYEGVSQVEIGIDSLYTIQAAGVDSPRRSSARPIVFYGTSIMQGACASRPGMNGTSILARRLDREAINLGFSGNAKLDYEMAHAMASIPNPHSFVLDFAPNCTDKMIENNMEKFITILREAHPSVPIVVVEQTYFPTMALSTVAHKEQVDKSAAMRVIFNRLVDAGDRKLHWVSGGELMGYDCEPYVDAVHSTDLGFMRYADTLYPLLRSLGK